MQNLAIAPLAADDFTAGLLIQIQSIASGELDARELAPANLQALCELLNAEYRAGRPLVTDAEFDALFIDALKDVQPDNPFLHAVEPEADVFAAPTVRHTRPMLSTDKAYTEDELRRYLERVEAAALALGQARPQFRVTPKLDGMACRDEGMRLVTRGDGLSGYDISHILDRGAVIAGGERGLGDGEIVVVQSYFDEVLKPVYDMAHPRNFITGFCGAESVKPYHRQATENNAVVFVPYLTLQAWTGSAEEFMDDWWGICTRIKASVPYLTDGVIIEAVDSEIRAHLGATSHYHRWMLAIKERGETAVTTARSITWQTGRTGRVTPVVELEPIQLSGATISRVTAHHAGAVRSQGIGAGATLKILRSGEVIPKIEAVIAPVEAELPESCPCCGHALEWEGDFLVCPNSLNCAAQASTALQHFFKTMGNADLFGPRTVDTLVEAGVTDLQAVFALTEERLRQLGFGAGQAANLVRELERCQRQEVEDWRFLAAFGIRHLGRGDSRHLLAAFTLEALIDGVSPPDVEQVKGFGAVTSASICASLTERAAQIGAMLPMFNLRRTGAAAPAAVAVQGEMAVADSPLAGKNVVFTGTMTSGSRSDMEEGARALGATVQSGVNGKTHYLICGEKVGASKTGKAASLGVTVITEAEYLALIGQA